MLAIGLRNFSLSKEPHLLELPNLMAVFIIKMELTHNNSKHIKLKIKEYLISQVAKLSKNKMLSINQRNKYLM
jgi:hypothetical protein